MNHDLADYVGRRKHDIVQANSERIGTLGERVLYEISRQVNMPMEDDVLLVSGLICRQVLNDAQKVKLHRLVDSRASETSPF